MRGLQPSLHRVQACTQEAAQPGLARVAAQGAKRKGVKNGAAKLTAAGDLLLRYAERMLVLATDAVIATRDLQARPFSTGAREAGRKDCHMRSSRLQLVTCD